MRAIAEVMHRQGGMDVYVPLLQGHGLKQPDGMKGVSHLAWIRNAAWAIGQTRRTARRLSVGGLSTGGALAVLLAFRDQDGQDLCSGARRSGQRLIDGGIFLFSAALRLRKQIILSGRTREQLLRTPIGTIADIWSERSRSSAQGVDHLIGDHPYRYARMDYGAAGELSRIIESLDRKRRTRRWGELRGLKQPLFVAHSEADSTADIRALANLVNASKLYNPNQVTFFRIGKDFQVPHASVVLAETAYGHSGSPMEPANPFFDEMMAAALQHIVTTPTH
jgi:pimeloyl-ACP methyl ester carboxylesterase